MMMTSSQVLSFRVPNVQCTITVSCSSVATEEQLTVIVHWTFGTLNESTWEEVIIILLLLALTLPLLFRYAWCYNALNQGGDEVATSLGYEISYPREVATSSPP